MIVVQRLTDDNEFEELGRVRDGEIITGEKRLTIVDSKDVWTDMSEEELSFRFNGPHIVASIVDEQELQQSMVATKGTPEGVPEGAEYVPPDYEPTEGEQVVVSDYGGNYVVSGRESEGDRQSEEEPKPEWFEQDVARYGQLEEMPEEGEYLSIGGDIVQIGEVEGNSIRSEATYDWEENDDYKVIDGVVSSRSSGVGSEDAVVFDNETVYLEFPEDSELEDGWYKSGDGDNEGTPVQSESGEEVKIPRTAPDAKYSPASSETLSHSMGTPWEKYQGQEYPTDARITDTIPLEEVGDIESLSDNQVDSVANGLAKADEWGLIDDLDKITASDSIGGIAAYQPGLNLMLFNPDSFTEEKYEEVDEGEYATENLKDTVIHEAVHVKHSEAMKEDPDIEFEDLAQELVNNRLEKGERDMIREFVSDYAGTNAFEVVAEVGVKILKGEEVRDEAMYLYEKYHGPEL